MVSNKLLSTYFINQPLNYYKDRIKRIFPFYIYALMVSLLIYHLGVTSTFLSTKPTMIDYLSNLTVIPLSYYMYTSQETFFLIPPAWSLGVELQFYILIPFLIQQDKAMFTLFVLSFITYLFATLGFINTDYFGYRLIIGVGFIFIFGIYIDKAIKGDKKVKSFASVFYILILFVSFYTFLYGELKAPYNYETLFALLFGIPFLYFFKSPMPKKIDAYLGFLSFGVFLLHFPALWIVELFNIEKFHILITMLLSTLLSSIGYHLIKLK